MSISRSARTRTSAFISCREATDSSGPTWWTPATRPSRPRWRFAAERPQDHDRPPIAAAPLFRHSAQLVSVGLDFSVALGGRAVFGSIAENAAALARQVLVARDGRRVDPLVVCV